MLIADNLYFADPSTFNDPLDTKPSLETDIATSELERVFGELVERRVRAEMTAAAQTIKYKGPKTVEHIARHSRRRAEQMIADIRYNATDPTFEIDDPLQFLLGQYVEQELLRQYDKGIVSFGERSDCPLMWSHYGDQHRGVCVGYSVPADVVSNVQKVNYGGGRLVTASMVAAMVDEKEEARRVVDEAVLLRKAADWSYEHEWRLIGRRGLQDSPLELEEVVFGIRCDSAVKYAVVKALERRRRPVNFFEMREVRGTFGLRRDALDIDELGAFLPRRARDAWEALEGLLVSFPEPPPQNTNPKGE